MHTASAARPEPETRRAYKVFRTIPTPWSDNNAYAQPVHIGLRLAHKGHFVHVDVDADKRRSTHFPFAPTTLLETIQ